MQEHGFGFTCPSHLIGWPKHQMLQPTRNLIQTMVLKKNWQNSARNIIASTVGFIWFAVIAFLEQMHQISIKIARKKNATNERVEKNERNRKKKHWKIAQVRASSNSARASWCERISWFEYVNFRSTTSPNGKNCFSANVRKPRHNFVSLCTHSVGEKKVSVRFFISPVFLQHIRMSLVFFFRCAQISGCYKRDSRNSYIIHRCKAKCSVCLEIADCMAVPNACNKVLNKLNEIEFTPFAW